MFKDKIRKLLGIEGSDKCNKTILKERQKESFAMYVKRQQPQH